MRIPIERGSVWTVPTAGGDALALVVSSVRGLARGRPEYQVVPLYTPNLLSTHSTADYLIRASESSLRLALYAALWNARPILERDLGRQVGIVDPVVLSGLRDAYLRLADPSIPVEPNRLGEKRLSADEQAWRSQEILAWQALTGRVLAPRVAVGGRHTFEAGDPWCAFSLTDLETLSFHVSRYDQLANSVQRSAIGLNVVVFEVPASAAVSPPDTDRTIWFTEASSSVETSYGINVPVSLVAGSVSCPEEHHMLESIGTAA